MALPALKRPASMPGILGGADQEVEDRSCHERPSVTRSDPRFACVSSRPFQTGITQVAQLCAAHQKNVSHLLWVMNRHARSLASTAAQPPTPDHEFTAPAATTNGARVGGQLHELRAGAQPWESRVVHGKRSREKGLGEGEAAATTYNTISVMRCCMASRKRGMELR